MLLVQHMEATNGRQGRAKVVPEESGGATVYVAALGVALVAIKIACAFNDSYDAYRNLLLSIATVVPR